MQVAYRLDTYAWGSVWWRFWRTCRNRQPPKPTTDKRQKTGIRGRGQNWRTTLLVSLKRCNYACLAWFTLIVQVKSHSVGSITLYGSIGGYFDSPECIWAEKGKMQVPAMTHRQLWQQSQVSWSNELIYGMTHPQTWHRLDINTGSKGIVTLIMDQLTKKRQRNAMSEEQKKRIRQSERWASWMWTERKIRVQMGCRLGRVALEIVSTLGWTLFYLFVFVLWLSRCW